MIRKEIGLLMVLLMVVFAGWASGAATSTYYSGPDKGIWHKSGNWENGVPGAITLTYVTDVANGGSDIWITKWATCKSYWADADYHKVTVEGGDFIIEDTLKLGGYTKYITNKFKDEMYIVEGTVRLKGTQASAFQPSSHGSIDMIGPHAVFQMDNTIPPALAGDGRMDILDGMLVMPGEVTNIDVADKHWKTMAWGGSGTFVYNYNTVNHPGMTEITAVNNPAAPKGLVVTPSSGLTVTEGGATTSYTINLSYNPDPCQVTVFIYGGYHVTTSISQVDFNSSNWDTPVTVTVTPVNDNIYEGSNTIYIKHELDTNCVAPLNPFSESNVWVPVVVVDNAGDGGFLITESGGSTAVAEGGATDTFTVALRTAPTAGKTVTVALEVSATDDVNQVSIDKKTLTFTSTTWSTPQTVTITAIDDAILEGGTPQTFNIRLGSSSNELSTSVYYARGAFVYGTVADNECGAWGYESPDVNRDCKVDIHDLDVLGAQWLLCTDPEGTGCTFSGQGSNGGGGGGGEVIQPTGSQDASVYGGVVEMDSPYGCYGLYNNAQISTVSIFTLPEGVTANMVASATLTVPQPDYIMQNAELGYPEGYNFDLVHIDANSDSTVCLVDIDEARELGVIGVFRAAGPVVQDMQRILSYDVTTQVKADMTAARASFAFKTKTIPGSFDPAHTLDYFYFPTVENTQGFPQSGAKLTIVLTGM